MSTKPVWDEDDETIRCGFCEEALDDAIRAIDNVSDEWEVRRVYCPNCDRKVHAKTLQELIKNHWTEHYLRWRRICQILGSSQSSGSIWVNATDTTFRELEAIFPGITAAWDKHISSKWSNFYFRVYPWTTRTDPKPHIIAFKLNNHGTLELCGDLRTKPRLFNGHPIRAFYIPEEEQWVIIR